MKGKGWGDIVKDKHCRYAELIKNIFGLAGVLLPAPLPAYACGGNAFDVPHWGIYLAVILFLVHGSVFFVLSSKMELIKKEIFAKRYSTAMFHVYVSLPILVGIFNAAVTLACIDVRSDQEKHIDGLWIYIVLPAVLSASFSFFAFMGVLSTHLSAEKCVQLGKILAASLVGVTAVTIFLLAYALWVIAPSLSTAINGIIEPSLSQDEIPTQSLY